MLLSWSLAGHKIAKTGRTSGHSAKQIPKAKVSAGVNSAWADKNESYEVMVGSYVITHQGGGVLVGPKGLWNWPVAHRDTGFGVWPNVYELVTAVPRLGAEG